MPAPVKRFNRIALVGRYAGAATAEPLARLAQFLVGRGHDVVDEAETARLAQLPGVILDPKRTSLSPAP